MTKLGMAWGFMAAGFLGVSALFLTQNINDGLGVATGLAGFWCAALAVLEMANGGDSNE